MLRHISGRDARGLCAAVIAVGTLVLAANHSPHFAPDLSTLVPGVRTLVSGAPACLTN